MIKGNKPGKIMLLLGDIALLYGALYLALLIRYGSIPTQVLWQDHNLPFFFVNIVWLIIFYKPLYLEFAIKKKLFIVIAMKNVEMRLKN